MTKSMVFLMFIFLLPALLFGGGAGDSGTVNRPVEPAVGVPEPVPEEKIKAYFFYEELCGICHEDFDKFISILQEKLPLEIRDQYPHSFETVNIYETSGRALYLQITDDMGVDRDMLSLPFLVLGGKVYQGYDSIDSNIREAYLTAAEDQFYYQKPYNPKTRKTGSSLFDDYVFNPDHVTIVYFYRITCPECAQVTPVVDALPESITVNGTERPLDVIKINTRSGNNGERIAAFFETWPVPDNDRMVPIVFFSDSYLAGFEAISAGLQQELEKPSAPWRLLRERQ